MILSLLALVICISVWVYDRNWYRFIERSVTPYDDNKEFNEMTCTGAYCSFYDREDAIKVGGEIIHKRAAWLKVEFFEKYWNKKQEIDKFPIMFSKVDSDGVEREHVILGHEILLRPFVDLPGDKSKNVIIYGTEIVCGDEGSKVSKSKSRCMFTLEEFLNLKVAKDYVIDIK